MEPVKAFVCFFCEERLGNMQCLKDHQDICRKRSSGLQSLFGDVGRHQEHRVPDQSQSEKRSFLEYFNVISVARAEARSKNCGEQVVCDAIIIDDSDEDDSEMELEPPAESPDKLNIPEVNSFRRSSNIRQIIGKKNGVVKSSNDTITTSHSAQKLLRIDISSPLGQRLRYHIDSLNSSKREVFDSERKRPLSNNSLILNNVEPRCSSPPFVRDSPFHNKLRHSSKYRVTFRSSRQSLYSHAYKFTSSQRKEFCRAYDSGLNLQARRLLRRMKQCRVELQELPPTSKTAYCSSLQESSGQNRLILPIQKVAASFTKLDYPVAEGTMVDCDSCYMIRPVVSDISLNEVSRREITMVRPSQDVSSTFDAVDNLSSDTSVNTVNVAVSAVARNVASNHDSGDSGDSGVCVVTKRQNCSDVPAAIAKPSVVEPGPTRHTSVNSVKTGRHAETADKECQTTDNDTNCRRSMTELPKETANTCGWSMSCDLPALTFFCNICASLIDCEVDAKSLIFDHYADHGVTNIDLVEETFPSGEVVLKLLELPAVTTKTNTKRTPSQATTPSTSVDEVMSSTCKSIMMQPSASSQAAGGSTSSARTQKKKRRRVTWADEVCNTVTPEPQHTPSPPSFHAAHQHAAGISLSGQRSTTSPSQPTHDGGLAYALYGNNKVNISSPPLNLACCAADTNLPSVTVDESASYSVPLGLTTRSETASNAVRYPHAAQTACERARMFWSKSNLREPTHYATMSVQLSTALHRQSNCSTNDVLLATSTSTLGGLSRVWHDTTDCVICLD